MHIIWQAVRRAATLHAAASGLTRMWRVGVTRCYARPIHLWQAHHGHHPELCSDTHSQGCTREARVCCVAGGAVSVGPGVLVRGEGAAAALHEPPVRAHVDEGPARGEPDTEAVDRCGARGVLATVYVRPGCPCQAVRRFLRGGSRLVVCVWRLPQLWRWEGRSRCAAEELEWITASCNGVRPSRASPTVRRAWQARADVAGFVSEGLARVRYTPLRGCCGRL